MMFKLIAAPRCVFCSRHIAEHTKPQRLACLRAHSIFVRRYDLSYDGLRARLRQELECYTTLARDMLIRKEPEETIVSLLGVLMAGPHPVTQAVECAAGEAVDLARWRWAHEDDDDEYSDWRPFDPDPRPHPGPQPDPEGDDE